MKKGIIREKGGISLVLAIVIAALIFVVSSVIRIERSYGGLEVFLYQFLIFFFLAMFLTFFMFRNRKISGIFGSLFILIIYAISDEVHQMMIPGSSFSWLYLNYALLGIFVFIISYLVRLGGKKKKFWKGKDDSMKHKEEVIELAKEKEDTLKKDDGDEVKGSDVVSKVKRVEKKVARKKPGIKKPEVKAKLEKKSDEKKEKPKALVKKPEKTDEKKVVEKKEAEVDEKPEEFEKPLEEAVGDILEEDKKSDEEIFDEQEDEILDQLRKKKPGDVSIDVESDIEQEWF